MRLLLIASIILMTLWPVPLWAATYYASNAATNGFSVGNDGNACTTLGSPCLTIGGCLGKQSAGDTCEINDGIYAEHVSAIVSSTSYATATQLKGYLGVSSSVVVKPNASCSRALTFSNERYLIISDLIFDGANCGFDAGKTDSGSDHIRFIRVVFRNAATQGLLLSLSSFIECLDCRAHNNGTHTNLHHGFYIGDSDNNLLSGGESDHNASMGVTIASGTPQGNIVERMRLHDNTYGYGPANESGNTGRNNLIYSNTSHGITAISNLGENFYNNSIYGNGGCGIFSDTDSTSNGNFKNNIVFGNGTNLCIGGSGHTLTTNLTTDPSWVNAAGGDFTLQAGSDAINTGTDLSGEGFADDYIGTSRPQNGTWDIGAVEFVSVGGSAHMGRRLQGIHGMRLLRHGRSGW